MATLISGKTLLNARRGYNPLLRSVFDLKISHKTRILPNQIKVLRKKSNKYVCRDTVYDNILTLTYYEIARYYLGRPHKRHKLLVPTFQIVSNPKVRWNDIHKKKYDILGRVKDEVLEF